MNPIRFKMNYIIVPIFLLFMIILFGCNQKKCLVTFRIDFKEQIVEINKGTILDYNLISSYEENEIEGFYYDEEYTLKYDFKEINTLQCEYNKAILEGIYERIKNIDISRTDLYNPFFLATLKHNCYYSMDEIVELEKEINNA